MQLPHNVEIEKAILGTMLLNGYFDQSVLLSADDFFSEAHQRIYLTLAEMADSGLHLEPATVADALQRKGELEKAGGAAYISSLTDGAPYGPGAEKSIKDYQKIIHEAAKRRRLITQTANVCQMARTEDLGRLSEEIGRLAYLLDAESEDEEDFSIEGLEREYAEHIRKLDGVSIRFGIKKLDDAAGGFQFGEVVTIIARTGVGKSAIGQNVINHFLQAYDDAGVVFFSLEMPKVQVFERQLQIFAGKTRDSVISAYKTGNRTSVAADAFMGLCAGRLAIIDKPGISLPQIQRHVRGLTKLKRLKPVRLVVIDYLGYLGGGPKNVGIVERTSELARGVKELAKSLNCVVLLIAQTSRKAGDGSEEVTVTDARDSGAIEDSADFLIGCWRPEMRSNVQASQVAEWRKVRGELWFRILKARRGVTSKFYAGFDGATMRVLPEKPRFQNSTTEVIQ